MKKLLAALLLFPLAGCTDAEMERMSALNNKHKVTLYSGGEEVRTWTSTGKVETESQSDGYYFKDAESGKLVRVTGDLVIEVID